MMALIPKSMTEALSSLVALAAAVSWLVIWFG